MIILNRWEEKCLQILTFVVSIVDVGNEILMAVKRTFNTVIHRKIHRVSIENIKNSWME
jgi:hypothetical protein